MGRAAEAGSDEVAQLSAKVAQLTAAVASRDVIGQAKGMLMVLLTLPEDGAWHLLVRLSQTTNRKVHDVAVVLVAHLTQSTPLPADVRLQLSGALLGGRTPDGSSAFDRPGPGDTVR